MFDVGRVCLKLAGRDSGQKCVIVEKLEGKYVMIDGMTRRRKCNTLHLEPIDQMIDIGSGSHDEVVAAFKEFGLEVVTTKSKQKTEKPKAARKVKDKPAKEPKEKKKPAKAEKKDKKKPETKKE